MTITRLFSAAKRQMSFGANRWSIDVHDAGIQIAHGCKRQVHVSRVNGRGEPVRYSVSYFDGVLKIIHGNNRNHRAKDFFLCDAHVRSDIAEDCGLVEPAFGVGSASEAIPARQQLRSLGLTDL